MEKNTLTEEDIIRTIAKEEVYDLGKKTTAVCLTLRNGFEVVGTAACVDEAHYNQNIGAKFARQRALDKVWELEGYVLQNLIKLGETNEPQAQV